MEPQDKLVVVVDDEVPLVDVICAALQEDGCQTTGCVRGQDAYATIRQTQPQLVILDIHMPGVDGVQVFRLLRADPATLHIPVIFLTANAPVLAQRLPDYQRMGARLLPKPFAIEDLLSAVDAMLPAWPD